MDGIDSSRPRIDIFLHHPQVGQPIAFCGLLHWAFGPRNFMKNSRNPGGTDDRGMSSVTLPWWDKPRRTMIEVVFRPCPAPPLSAKLF